jgi:hypothetical protein
MENLSLVAIDAGASVLGAAPIFLANLTRLGLASMPPDAEIADEARYVRLETSTPLMALENYIRGRGRQPVILRGLIQLTPLGKAFLRACLPSQR